MEHTGYLGNSRIVLNHFDVSTQADIQHIALSYESEDEIMARIHCKGKRGTPHYSKQDIREQYCISDRGLGALESESQSLFGCLSTHQSSPCSNRTSLLTACVRQKVPSDENLHDLYKRHHSEYAPYPRRNRYPWAPLGPDIYKFDEDLNSSYFRRKACIDPSRYTWMPSDDESVRMEKPKSILEPYHPNQMTPPAPPRQKHVSFARSHTLTSFDDAIVSLSSSPSYLNRMSRSQERLLDVRKTEITPITKQPEPSENVLILDKIKRAPMKTQATQTEACLGRKPVPPATINLSPRTIHRVKMVSQGAQTNGFIFNGRKLIKSYSEAGSQFGKPMKNELYMCEPVLDHEPLHRTQSDEPPRSPFMLTSPPVLPVVMEPPSHIQSDSSSLSKSDHESEDSESKREIFIDFKPQVPSSKGKSVRRPLIKTVSDGEILMEQRKKHKNDDSIVPQKQVTSISHEDIISDDQPHIFTPYFQQTPIRYEGICHKLSNHFYADSFSSSGMQAQDSIDEEFHENLIYSNIYVNDEDHLSTADVSGRYRNVSPNDEGVVPSLCRLPDRRLSPFASNDSLSNDLSCYRDHSDEIWNESQVTVLQVDSGTDNGTGVSSSEINSVTSPGSMVLLTPSSRRKHMLMLQHQQRSSVDTETLEEEIVEQAQSETTRPAVEKVPKSSENAKQQYLSTYRTLSSSWRRHTPEPPSESPQPAIVPDLLLARTDSCKTNTDVSESTTTDDYITANSGTDSSRKSGSTKNGSSFESNKPDLFGDDMVVPSFSPSLLIEDSHSLSNTPVPEHCPARSSPSDTSSSCGSYSVSGSCPDILEKSAVPSTTKLCISEDERSIQYSSSGYYESPIEDESIWKTPKNTEDEEETKMKKRPYSLDINVTDTFIHVGGKSRSAHKRETKISPNKDLTVAEKPKRVKSRTRSPMQIHKRNQQAKKIINSQSKSDEEHYKVSIDENKVTSDDSSYDFKVNKYLANQTSPRKGKKNKDNNRRKSLPRSPTIQKSTKRRESSDDKPSSLPGSLPRRKSSKQSREVQGDGQASDHYSPPGSPSLKRHSPKISPDSTKLKALSAESLRSVSPGSDSVFYSDPSSAQHTIEHQVHCLHCGKEVDIITTDEFDKNASNGNNQHDIVQPPAGFEDSPVQKYASGKLYKKMDRRIRSEERSQIEYRRHRHKSDVRAKSEERDAKVSRCKLRPMAKSATTSQEGLKATDSSPSVLPGAPDDDDDDFGVYTVPYLENPWIYIDEGEEVHTVAKICPSDSDRRGSISSTESEQEFRRRYQLVTHRMVHRKSCLEMYKRQTSKSFVNGILESDQVEHDYLKQSLEELYKLMLVIWGIQARSLKYKQALRNECDKTVVVQRESGEFGFRIHGSKPVVISAIEPGTPAECSGLEVGDIVLAVNGISVLEKSHSEVVKIAHAGSDTLTLEVARTCYAISPTEDKNPPRPLHSGYLWKLTGYASGVPSNKWIRRWFCLRQNNCLYYYKTDSDKQPVGVVMLSDQEIQKVTDEEGQLPTPYKFVITKQDAVPLHLAADTSGAEARWLEVISDAIGDKHTVDDFLEEIKRNLALPVNRIQKPDCFGYLVKLGTQWKSWSRRYCVLKDACLYFYQDATSTSAFGVACLHGYKVQQATTGNKKHAFEICPPDSNEKHYHFHAESETDRKRWIAALEYSIDKWFRVQ